MAVYISDRRLWLDAEGKVVEDGDPKAHSLLISGPGKKIPEAQARALGLMGDEPTGDIPDEVGVAEAAGTEPEPEPETEPETETSGSGEPVLHEEPEPEPPSRRRR